MSESAREENTPHTWRSETLEQNATIRLAVGLAHAVPGTDLTLRRVDGGRLVAANRAGADVDLCSLRQTIIAGLCPDRPDASQCIEVDEIAGSLHETDQGVYRSEGQRPLYWFATLLHQDRVIDLLGELERPDITADELEATLKPDACLGVTTVGLAGFDPAGELAAAEMTRRLYEVCLVDELIARCRRPERPSVSRRKEQPND